MKKPDVEYYVYFGAYIIEKDFLKHEEHIDYLYKKKIKKHTELKDFYKFGRHKLSDLCQKIHIIGHYTDMINKGFWITSKAAENKDSDFRFGLAFLNTCTHNVHHKIFHMHLDCKQTLCCCNDVYCYRVFEDKNAAISGAKLLKSFLQMNKICDEKTYKKKTDNPRKLFKDVFKFDPPKFCVNLVTVDPDGNDISHETY